MRRAYVSALVLMSSYATVACGSSDTKSTPVAREHVTEAPPGGVDVSVTFPSDGAKGVTNSVHVWVLASAYDAGANCADLVGGGLDPYSPSLEQLGDVVAKDGLDGKIPVKNVGSGKVFVYVEAVDYTGHVEWAGCQEVTVKGTTATTVTLGKARVYDCSDPAAKDGDPCDDGKLCFVGETCKDGQCQGSIVRDCPSGDSCTTGQCTEDQGCILVAAPNGNPCSDDDQCTLADHCDAGKCVGTAKDCTAEAGPCSRSLGCDSFSGECQTSPNYDADGQPCDDGDFCTDGDTCSSGTCYGYQPHDCGVSSGCASGYCDSTLGRCVTTNSAPGTYCSDGLYCTTNDMCDGLGHCSGTPVVCSSGTDAACGGTCSEIYGGCQYASSSTPCYSITCSTYGYTGTAHCDGYGTCYYGYCY